MATYTKETALYDTGAIADDIDDASKTATSFLAVDGTGVMVYDGSNGVQTPTNPSATTNNVLIDPDSVDIRKGSTVLASFGTETVIKTANGTELAHFGYDEGQAESGTAIAPYYTLGARASDSDVGNYSVAEGYQTTASRPASHAEGHRTTASGADSHAEGFRTAANGESSHAEGYRTTASGTDSHAEGFWTTASGTDSHAQNTRTIAQRQSQTALGAYNKADTGGANGRERGDYVVIIGNGTADDDDHRSNALTVDWFGNVEAAGTVNGHQRRKTLWASDTGWNSGNLKVDGLSDYHMFEVSFSGIGTHATVWISGSGATAYFRGSGSYCTTASITDYIIGATANLNTDTLTWVAAKERITSISGKNITAINNIVVTSIIGVM